MNDDDDIGINKNNNEMGKFTLCLVTILTAIIIIIVQ